MVIRCHLNKQSDRGGGRVCIVLVGKMEAEKEEIVVWVGCYWILVLLSLVSAPP